jgi:hypothetical protein
MAIPYLNIARAVMLRSNQFGDAVTATALEALFVNTLVNAIAGMEIPLSALKLAILASEKKLAETIGFSTWDIGRAALYARSDNLVSGSVLPTISSGGNEFVGAFSGVFDQSDESPLTEKGKSEIMRLNRLYAAGALRIRPYHFHKAGLKLLHTRDGAYFEGCAWSYDVQGAAYDADGWSILPQTCETWLVADVLANTAQENWFVTEAGVYAQIASTCAMDVKNGLTPSATLPDTTSSPEPVKN